MTEQPKLHAYAVTLVFGPLIVTNMSVAPNEVMATALATADSVRALAPTEPLTMLNVAQLEPEWLRAALWAIETGGQPARVLSLVPRGTAETQAEIVARPEHAQEQLNPLDLGWCQRHHMHFARTAHCGLCAAEDDAPAPPAA